MQSNRLEKSSVSLKSGTLMRSELKMGSRIPASDLTLVTGADGMVIVRSIVWRLRRLLLEETPEHSYAITSWFSCKEQLLVQSVALGQS